MNVKTLFRLLLSTGFILWILSLIGDSQGKIPESTYGMICSVILTVLGIYYWFKSFKKERGYYPKLLKVFKKLNKDMAKNPFNGIIFMVMHLLKFYTLMFVFSIVLIFVGYLTLGQSEPVKVTQNYCENNNDIVEITGQINHYGILRNVSSKWDSENGSSEISLTFVSENGVFDVSSMLEKENGEWKVKYLNLINKNTGANNVYN